MEQGDKCIPDAPKQYKLNFKTLIYSFNTVDFRWVRIITGGTPSYLYDNWGYFLKTLFNHKNIETPWACVECQHLGTTQHNSQSITICNV